MIDNIWLAIKTFMATHTQHAWLENLFIVLAIIGGITVIVLTVMYVIKINRYIHKVDKSIKKSKRSSNKNVLIMLKKKKNSTF